MVLTNLNQKGGVGKTTNTIHIGAYLAVKGKKVLLIDADSQCDLTAGTGINNVEYTIEDFLEGKPGLKLKKRSDDFFVLPGSPNFYAGKYKRNALKNVLSNPELYNFFDYIFIDVPPEAVNPYHVTPAELALCASDYFICTIKPDMFSVKNLDAFLGRVFELRDKHNKDLNFGGVYFSDVLVTKNIFDDYYNTLKAKAPDILFESFIRRDAEVEKSARYGKTIFQYNPNCRASADFKNLTEELLRRITN